MKASEQKITSFLTTTKVQFTIPVYQRNYDWKNDQCKQLFNDILTIGSDDSIPNHFIGSIVYIHNGIYTSSHIQEWIIIDGQQRLTTITLIYLALYHSARLKGEIIADEINETILMNKFSSEKYKLKLKPSDNYISAMEYLYQGNFKDKFPHFSRLIENFKYFQSCITEDNTEIVMKGLDKLMFVEVALERGKDNPQRIFESLNSTGLALSEADLIRNYILMDLESEKQIRFFQYWDKIEKAAKDEGNNESKVSDFIRDYLTKINKKIPTKSKIYESFKDKYKRISEDELVDLQQFSTYYGNLINPKRETDLDISLNLQYIKQLEINTSYPFLLNVYHDYIEGKIGKSHFIQILELIQSFVIRRLIVGLPTNALNKIFMTLYDEKKLISLSDSDSDYVEIIIKSLLGRERNQRFPNDKEVVENLRYKDIYNLLPKNRTYLLERLENFENKETVSVIHNKDITIEHIFPQNPDKAWDDDLNKEEYEFMQQNLHTLANLTLTGYNAELSNKQFIKKRELYEESRLWLNKSLNSLSSWNKVEWEKRFNLLSERFLRIWKRPIYENIIYNSEINLTELEDLTNKRLIYAKFRDIKLQSSNMVELYRDVIKQLFKEDPAYFLESRLVSKLNIVPTEKKDSLNSPTSLNDDYYIETNYSNNVKLERLKLVLTELDLEDELFVCLAS